MYHILGGKSTKRPLTKAYAYTSTTFSAQFHEKAPAARCLILYKVFPQIWNLRQKIVNCFAGFKITARAAIHDAFFHAAFTHLAFRAVANLYAVSLA
jgi:hypothetical protein